MIILLYQIINIEIILEADFEILGLFGYACLHMGFPDFNM